MSTFDQPNVNRCDANRRRRKAAAESKRWRTVHTDPLKGENKAIDRCLMTSMQLFFFFPPLETMQYLLVRTKKLIDFKIITLINGSSLPFRHRKRNFLLYLYHYYTKRPDTEKPTATVSATEKIKLGRPNTMKWYFYINEELTGTCCQLR